MTTFRRDGNNSSWLKDYSQTGQYADVELLSCVAPSELLSPVTPNSSDPTHRSNGLHAHFQRFPVHSQVLAASSYLLRSVLDDVLQAPCTVQSAVVPQIILPEVDASTIGSFVTLIYSGRVSLATQDETDSVRQLLGMFDVWDSHISESIEDASCNPHQSAMVKVVYRRTAANVINNNRDHQRLLTAQSKVVANNNQPSKLAKRHRPLSSVMAPNPSPVPPNPPLTAREGIVPPASVKQSPPVPQRAPPELHPIISHSARVKQSSPIPHPPPSEAQPIFSDLQSFRDDDSPSDDDDLDDPAVPDHQITPAALKDPAQFPTVTVKMPSISANKDATSASSLECDICLKLCKDLDELLSHQSTCVPEEQRCCMCGEMFANKFVLRTHMNEHTADGSEPLQKKRLLVKDDPTRPTTFECPLCHKQLQTLHALKVHERVHTGEKPYSCTICDKFFFDRSGLIGHNKRFHGTKEKKYRCDECGKRFIERSDLTKHQRVHTGERPYPCTVCEKRFADSSGMHKHMLIHTGEKPFGCTICGDRFTQNISLQGHMERIHSGKRPFGCTICTKRFTEKAAVGRHMKTAHGGRQLHECLTCGKKFSQNWHLKRHERTHSDTKPFKREKMYTNDLAEQTQHSESDEDIQERIAVRRKRRNFVNSTSTAPNGTTMIKIEECV